MPVDSFPDLALKLALQDAVATADLTDEEAALIAAARIPPEHRYSVDEDA